jgi:hypothetical protein
MQNKVVLFENNELVKELMRNDEYYSCFASLVEEHKLILDQDNRFSEIAYTPHDFKHHVVGVMTNLSDLFEFMDLKKMVNSKELFSLLTACLLHDITMVYNPEMRYSHSFKNAADLYPAFVERIKKVVEKDWSILFSENNISESYNLDQNDNLLKFKKLTEEIIKNNYDQSRQFRFRGCEEAIAWIIFGHSDIKFEGISEKICTLEESLYQNAKVDNGENKNMKLRMFSALLRWADELDCAKRRIEGILRNEPEESKKYWDKLAMVKGVFGIKTTMISIQLNVDVIDKDIDYYLPLIYELESKLNDEMELVTSVFRTEGVRFNQRFVFDWLDNNVLKEKYEKFKIRLKKENITNSNEPKGPNQESERYQSFSNKDKINKEIIKELKKSIEERIITKDLFLDVHCKLPKNNGTKVKQRIRNKINCNGLLVYQDILNGITQAFLNSLFTGSFYKPPEKMGDEYVLIGVANSGAIIVSHMAFAANLPFTYMIPKTKGNYFTDQEISDDEFVNVVCSDSEFKKKFVIVVANTHTGATLMDICSKITEKFKGSFSEPVIGKVIGLFNRENLKKGEISIKNFLKRDYKVQQVSFLINDYPVEFCTVKEPKNCTYRKLSKESF